MSRKFVIILSLKIPPHLICVATSVGKLHLNYSYKLLNAKSIPCYSYKVTFLKGNLLQFLLHFKSNLLLVTFCKHENNNIKY